VLQSFYSHHTIQTARNSEETHFASLEEAVSLKETPSRLKRNYFYSWSHIHSAIGLPQPEQTSSSMGSSLGVHPHDSHIFVSLHKCTSNLIEQICSLHLADTQPSCRTQNFGTKINYSIVCSYSTGHYDPVQGQGGSPLKTCLKNSWFDTGCRSPAVQ
jgi:hypothetical protein